jgi:hypothetical protein
LREGGGGLGSELLRPWGVQVRVNQFRLALPLALAVLAGCSYFYDQEGAVKRVCGPDVEQAPCGPGVEIGHTYSFDLLAHCGIEWAYFNSHYWVPRKKVAVPSAWNPIERGTMTLTEPDVAHFEGASPGKVDFVPAPVGYKPTPCA